MEKLYTQVEAAKELKVTRQYINQLIRSGTIAGQGYPKKISETELLKLKLKGVGGVRFDNFIKVGDSMYRTATVQEKKILSKFIKDLNNDAENISRQIKIDVLNLEKDFLVKIK